MSRRTQLIFAAVASFAMAGALVGCSQPAASSDQLQVTAPENPGTSALVMPKGSIDQAVKGLPDLAKRVMQESKVPGMAVAVVHDGKMVFARGFGVKKEGEPGAIDPYTVFQLASLSKSVGATVVATQVTQSVLSWDTPVVQELPDFTLADPWVTAHATVGDFYAHRTGLPRAAGDSLEDIGYDRDYVMSHL
jgi:CubicO group peptidase (beta-lactamase class C family)